MAVTNITYNSFDLQDGDHITSELVDSSAFERSLGIHDRMRRAGAIITDDTYHKKIIPVKGKIMGSSVSNLEGRIDTFEDAMAVKDKNLDIDYNSTTRRYVATPQRVGVFRPVRAATWANFEIDFLVTELGKDTSSTSLLSTTAQTTSPINNAITVSGSSPEQYLLITYTLNSFTGASINTITFKNNETGQAINVSRGWTATEVIEIDVDNQTAKVGSAEVDWSGVFPVFAPGSRTLTVSDDFTARNYDITATQVKRYL